MPTTTDDLIARLERLAERYESNKLSDHARGVRHALREVQAFFAPVKLRCPDRSNMAKKNKQDNHGPWHIVSRVTGKHLGPFSTELDCVMARAMGHPDWATGIDMDQAAFDRHMARS